MTKTEIEEIRTQATNKPEKALLLIQSWLDRACAKADFELLNQAHELRIKEMGKWNPKLAITRHDVPVRVDLLAAYSSGKRDFVLRALEISVGPLAMQDLYDSAEDDEEIRDLLISLDQDCETYEIETADGDEE
ncbi:MAG: hypothetical protein J0L82_10275 [Deltaproteobacteria bacterium]|jgi:hypothetical protein|nr:hypothetical protein [Deltaproteobacteria bacterium]